MFAAKCLILLFVGYASGHGYVAVPHSRVSRCFLGNARMSGIWNQQSSGDPGCDQAFWDARNRGVNAYAQFTSRMAYVGRNDFGSRHTFEDGSLLSNTEVCSAGSQAGYRGDGDFRSMDNAFNWYLNELPRSNSRYTDVRLRFCATAPHHTNRWFIYHFKHDPRRVPVTWDRLVFVKEIPTQPLTTTPGPLQNCFTHDTPFNSFYDLTVPIDLQETGTIVVVQQNDAFFSWEFNINCVDYRTVGPSPPPTPPPPGVPPPPHLCVAPNCVAGNDLIAPHRNPHWFFRCLNGVRSQQLCPNGSLFTRNLMCENIPIHESDRIECQDWSIIQ